MLKKEFIEKIKLPDRLESFTTTDKVIIPYDLFYKWAIKNAKSKPKLLDKLYGESDGSSNVWGLPKGFSPNVSSFHLHWKDYENLKNIIYQWSDTWSNNTFATRIIILNYSPTCLEENIDIEPGYVYLKKDFIVRI